MLEIKDECYKGTRILVGNEKRIVCNKMIEYLKLNGFVEIQIPIIQFQDTFSGKVGDENSNMMFNFTDRGNRNICLAPEYTAIIQKLAKGRYKYEHDLKLFYLAECFRGENPQAGRYRQFTQLGVEILNPRDFKSAFESCVKYAVDLIDEFVTTDYQIDLNAVRGLDYYKGGRGFEIKCEALGSSKQVCGGGEYDGGVGFALGIDRLMNLIK